MHEHFQPPQYAFPASPTPIAQAMRENVRASGGARWFSRQASRLPDAA